jgi:hypothetical protein
MLRRRFLEGRTVTILVAQRILIVQFNRVARKVTEQDEPKSATLNSFSFGDRSGSSFSVWRAGNEPGKHLNT